MLEALTNLNKELNAIIQKVRNYAQNLPANSQIVERIQGLVLTWSVSVGPNLAAVGVPREVLRRVDAMTASAARLTAKTTRKNVYLSVLYALRRALIEQVLVEVPRISPALLFAATRPAPAVLFPQISDLPNQLVPNALHGWAEPINKFLETHAFDKNVFIMVSYRAELRPIVNRVKRELLKLDLNPILANEHKLTDDLYNPIACLLCCAYGVAIFGRAESKQIHNPNVVYELGMMTLLKRQCVILKHSKLKRMPTDLLHRLYEDYTTQKQAGEKLQEWWARNNPE